MSMKDKRENTLGRGEDHMTSHTHHILQTQVQAPGAAINLSFCCFTVKDLDTDKYVHLVSALTSQFSHEFGHHTDNQES